MFLDERGTAQRRVVCVNVERLKIFSSLGERCLDPLMKPIKWQSGCATIRPEDNTSISSSISRKTVIWLSAAIIPPLLLTIGFNIGQNELISSLDAIL